MYIGFFHIAFEGVTKNWCPWMQALFHSLSQFRLYDMLNTMLLKIPRQLPYWDQLRSLRVA